MKSKYIGFWIVLLASGLFLVGGVVPAYASEAALVIEISPKKVEIDSFYHGERLALKGVIPAGCKPVIILLGERKEHSLKRKGKVGLLWMNVGNVTVKDAPEMYYLLTSVENLDALAPADVLAEHGIGYDALRELISIEQGSSKNDEMFQEFIKLMEKMGLYKVSFSTIKLEREEANMAHFSATAPIPAQVPPGKYEAHLYCFTGRQLTSNSSAEFIVEKVGLTQWLSTLAFAHAATYGILSILVAVAAGLLMGLLFGSKKKEPH